MLETFPLLLELDKESREAQNLYPWGWYLCWVPSEADSEKS